MRQSGFTFIEVIILAMIVAMLTCLAFPQFETLVVKSRLSQMFLDLNLLEKDFIYCMDENNGKLPNIPREDIEDIVALQPFDLPKQVKFFWYEAEGGDDQYVIYVRTSSEKIDYLCEFRVDNGVRTWALKEEHWYTPTLYNTLTRRDEKNIVWL